MGVRKLLLIRLTWFILLTLALLQVFINTQVQTDIASFMPAGKNEQQRQLLEEFQQGPAARLWLIAITGEASDADAQQIISQSKQLAASLRRSGLFSSVVNGSVAIGDRLSKRLFSYRYLLDDSIDEDSFSVTELKLTFQQRLDEMTSPFSSFSKQLLIYDPTAAMRRVSVRLQGNQSTLESQDKVWYSSKEKEALLIVSSKESGRNIDAQKKAYNRILSAFEQVQGSINSSLIVSGEPLFAIAARDSIRKESRRLSIAAGVFMLAFMFFVFRNGPLVLLSLLPLGAGLLIATAAVSLLYGSIHGITLAFGITLLGVAIDYPVHLFMHAKKTGSLQQAATRVWPILRLGVLTTALGYGAMIWTGFSGLSQLGVFSLVGLITAALATQTLLPALKRDVSGEIPVLQRRVLSLMNSRLSSLAGITLLVFILVSLLGHKFFLPDDIWSRDIAALSPVPAKLIQQDRMLGSRLGLPEVTSMIRVGGSDVEDVLRKEERLKPVLEQAIREKTITSFRSAAELLPSIHSQQLRQSQLPDREALSRRMDNALQDLPFKAASFKPFLDEVEESKSLAILKPTDMRGTAVGTALDGLLSTGDRGATGLIYLTGLQDNKAIEKIIRAAALPQVTFINIKSATNELMQDFRQEILLRMAWVAVIIVLVLLMGLKSILQSFRVITPVALAVLFAALVPLWLGEALNIFHLVSLLLVAGLGLDYALFFNSIRDDQENADTVVYSLVICAISSLAVFAMLAVSNIPVLHAIGITVTSGVIAAFVLSWMFSSIQRGKMKDEGGHCRERAFSAKELN
ncbi:MAG: MMPL family transporter [Gammaproteobacteria bacterium]|nr:MMPL family transporter [Gammaproteobacteria bacterium]